MIGSQLQELFQATHTLVGNQVLFMDGQGVHCPKRVILKQVESCITLVLMFKSTTW